MTDPSSNQELSKESVESELKHRFGTPLRDSKKILAFETAGGKQIALDRDRPPAQFWIEAEQPISDRFSPERYEASRPRHSGLPDRLAHKPPGNGLPRPVAVVRIAAKSDLTELLDWYDGQNAGLNRERLEDYKRTFLEKFPDFPDLGFSAQTGTYFAEERRYKSDLIGLAQDALQSSAYTDEESLGARLLDILTGQAGTESNLLGWRTDGHIRELRASHPNALERATAKLARAKDSNQAVADFIETVWPLLSEGGSQRPYSESRNLPTMLRALVTPQNAYGINTSPVARAARNLLGTKIFSNNPLRPSEYAAVTRLADDLRKVMSEEWSWKPRDLWDVQGFIWVNRSPDDNPDDELPEEIEESKESSAMPQIPLNQILYGPPGTGKTFATAQKAVEICNGNAPTPGPELMSEYARLVAAGRIEFVTFHQSYTYEEFIEGLRPVQGEDHSTGFSLQPEPGLFRRISNRAGLSVGPSSPDIRIADRQVFKMSIGEAANPDDAYLFEEAIQKNCALLGFGNIDWSDAKFSEPQAFIDAYVAAGELKDGQPPTKLSGNVQASLFFRSKMNRGDIVIVSKSRSIKFGFMRNDLGA